MFTHGFVESWHHSVVPPLPPQAPTVTPLDLALPRLELLYRNGTPTAEGGEGRGRGGGGARAAAARGPKPPGKGISRSTATTVPQASSLYPVGARHEAATTRQSGAVAAAAPSFSNDGTGLNDRNRKGPRAPRSSQRGPALEAANTPNVTTLSRRNAGEADEDSPWERNLGALHVHAGTLAHAQSSSCLCSV